MKVNTKILALMAAMAVGSAAAEGTPSDTTIINTAVATYTDPTSGQNATAQSNTVSTVVLPKPDFDIVYRAGADGTTATGALPAGYEAQVLPGGELATAYSVQNNGNVNNYVVQIAPNTVGSPNAPTGVLYYIDTNGDGILSATERAAGPVTSVTVPVDDPSTPQDEGVVSIIQVITVPGDAAAEAVFAASPQGTADVFSNGTIAPTTEAANDLQYSRAVMYAPSLTNDPIDGDPATPGQQGPGTTITPPGTNTPVPGYPDPTRPTTSIVAISGDLQTAYPRADADALPDTVAFVNSLTNKGTLDDTISLFPTDKVGEGGLPIGTRNPDGSFTLPGGVTVRFTDAAGNPLPLVDGYPTVKVKAGETVNYRTVVTYPDYDSDPASNPDLIKIIIGADSGNDAGIAANGTSTDIVYPSQLQFGDATPKLGTTPDPTPIQTVVPGANAGTGIGVDTDSSAVFPMDIANTGAYADTYTLIGSVVVPVTNADGTVTNQTVPVRYFTDTNGDGQPDTELTFETGANGSRTYTTGPVLADNELKVYAVVDIPSGTQATTRNGVTDLLTVSQKVTASYSGITREDNNDQIAVNQPTTGGVSLTKSEPAAARPGDPLSYTITAKNNFNAAIRNFYVTESNANPSTNVFTWTTFQSVTATKTFGQGTILYRFNGGNWQSSAAPTSGTTITSVDVGVDTNGNGTVDGNDLFPAQGQLDITFNVIVK